MSPWDVGHVEENSSASTYVVEEANPLETSPRFSLPTDTRITSHLVTIIGCSDTVVTLPAEGRTFKSQAFQIA
jgi:hypothetical protein